MRHLADIANIEEYLRVAHEQTTLVHDTLVGRDTHPLFDDKIHDPFDYYLAMEIERITGAIIHLKLNVESYIDFNKDVLIS